MSSFGVVLDACVLIPAPIRDTLLRAATAEFYRLQLTDDILEEVRRNLAGKFTTKEKAQKVVDKVKKTFPEAFIKDHHLLIASMPVNEKDRHVLAAAVFSGAQVIVTENLKHFPCHLLDPFNIEAQSSDSFLTNLFYDNSECMINILKDQARILYKPSKTVLEVLDGLKLQAPTFVSLAKQALEDENVLFPLNISLSI